MFFTANVNLVSEQTVFQFIKNYYSPSPQLIMLYYIVCYVMLCYVNVCSRTFIWLIHLYNNII